MQYILDELYHTFYQASTWTDLKAEIEINHKELIQTLSKEDRKKVLRILDAGSQITEFQSQESFQKGFLLAMNLCMELQQMQVNSIL